MKFSFSRKVGILVLMVLNALVLGSCAVFKSKSLNEITVATYNLRMDTKSDGVNTWSNRKEEVKALVRYHDFDIMGTQEGFLHQLEDITELSEYKFIGKGREDGKKKGEHSAIIYKKDRFKVLDSGDFWLSETPDVPGKGWDAKCCNRICSWAKMRDQKTKNVFYVFNVHFDHEGVVARVESGKLMVKKITEIAGTYPVVLTGDFNSVPESEQIFTIGTFLKDTYKVSEQAPYGPVGTFNSFKWDAPYKERIDYIFVSDNFKVLKYGALTDNKNQRWPSDHIPVVSKIVLKK